MVCELLHDLEKSQRRPIAAQEHQSQLYFVRFSELSEIVQEANGLPDGKDAVLFWPKVILARIGQASFSDLVIALSQRETVKDSHT